LEDDEDDEDEADDEDEDGSESGASSSAAAAPLPPLLPPPVLLRRKRWRRLEGVKGCSEGVMGVRGYVSFFRVLIVPFRFVGLMPGAPS
jgi:hypothetical protein